MSGHSILLIFQIRFSIRHISFKIKCRTVQIYDLAIIEKNAGRNVDTQTNIRSLKYYEVNHFVFKVTQMNVCKSLLC